MRKRYYHFTSDLKLANGDGREIKVGETVSVEGPIIICRNGLHGSVKPIDALLYAPSTTKYLHIVEIWGDVVNQDDKVCGRNRKVVKTIQCERLLHEFAIWCAEQALNLVDNPDPRSLKALEVKRLWLDGKATDKELAVARTAAWTAARAAAYTAAWTAARTAAYTAARAVACTAARAVACTAARDAQNEKLTQMIWRAM